MNFSQFLLIVRARKRIILVTLLVTVALTLAVSLVLPKTYKAAASVVLNYKGVDSVTGMIMPSQLMTGYTATQIDIITSKNVALRVIDQLKLAQNPDVLKQFNDSTGGKGSVNDWLAEALLKKLEVEPARDSSVVEIIFKGTDPNFVAVVANSFAEQYQRASIQLKVDPMKKAAAYFDDQTRQQRDVLEAAQSRLSKYQQEKGIFSVDNRLDVESNRLNDLSGQLVVAQGQQMEASSRQQMALGSSGAESPDVASNMLVQNMKAALSSAESKFADISQRLDKNHPQYQSAKAEVEQLRADLARQTQVVSNSVSNNAQILRQRESAVAAALTAQKNKVLELNRTRDELNVLQKDVETAQRNFDAVSLRLSQTRIEGQAEQSDVSLLNPAVAPISPSGPRVLLNTLLAVFVGLFFGFSFAMIAELLHRVVRSEIDLVESLPAPLLGAIEWRATGPARRTMLQKLLPRRLRLN
jgi:succinoglycan biosynthesis transport protein ExoP